MKSCKKQLNKYLIPHQGNDFSPLILRHKSLKVIAVFVVALKIGISFLLIFAPALVNPIDITNQNIINLTNQQRLNAGLPQFELDNQLSQAAYAKAQNMLSEQYFAHYSPSNISPWYWFNQAGYEYAYAGENLAMDFVQAEDVLGGWMASDTHRRNILNSNYADIGIGIVEGDYKGAKTIIIVQMLGAPAPPTTLAVSSTIEEVVEKNPSEETVTEEIVEQENLPEVQSEETVIIPSIVEPNTYDIVVRVEEKEDTEVPAEENKETKVAVLIGDSSSELNKSGDEYIGSIKDEREIPTQNINVVMEDEEKNVVTTPIANTEFFKTSIISPQTFFSSERLIQIILYSKNFFLALFIFLSLVLVLNVLIKVRVQHKPNIIYSLLVIYLIGVIIIV